MLKTGRWVGAAIGLCSVGCVSNHTVRGPEARPDTTQAPPVTTPAANKPASDSLALAGASAEPAAPSPPPAAPSPPPAASAVAPASSPRSGLCKFASGDFVRDEVTQGKGARYVVGIEQGRVARVHFEDGSTDMPIVGPARQSDDEPMPTLSEGQPASVMLFDEYMQAYPSVQLVLRGSTVEGTHPWPAANKTRYTLACVWN